MRAWPRRCRSESSTSRASPRRTPPRSTREDDPEFRAWLADMLETFTDARADRYRQLLAVVNAWSQRPATVPAWEWVGEALRA
jgi:hypothetical protein